MHSQRSISALLLLLPLACAEQTFGTGIGRAPVEPVARPTLELVRLTEVFVTGATAAQHFVELSYDAAAGSADLDLSRFSLCSAVTCLPLTGTVVAGARAAPLVDGLGLFPGVDEVALVDTDGVVHAYLAWGADPSIFGSALAARAIASGAAVAGDFVPLPFPFDASIRAGGGGDTSVIRELTGEGCAAPSEKTVGTVDPARCADPGRPLAVTEIFAGDPAVGDSWVEITNSGGDAVYLYGVRLCQMPECLVFGRSDLIAAQGQIVVHMGVVEDSAALAEIDADPAQFLFPEAAPVREAGELVLVAPGASLLTVPESYLSFVRYGGTNGVLSDTAIAAGIWPAPLATADAPRVSGESLSLGQNSLVGTSPWAPVDPPWNSTLPTKLAPNLDISLRSQLWNSCSYPAPWLKAPISVLAITSVTDSTPDSVVLSNRDPAGAVVLLEHFSLALGNSVLSLASAGSTPGEIASGETITVEIVATGTSCADVTAFCWADSTAMIAANGEATLLELALNSSTDLIVQHLQWGSGSKIRATAAHSIGAWPLETCDLPALAPGIALELIAGLEGQGVGDYE